MLGNTHCGWPYYCSQYQTSLRVIPFLLDGGLYLLALENSSVARRLALAREPWGETPSRRSQGYHSALFLLSAGLGARGCATNWQSTVADPRHLAAGTRNKPLQLGAVYPEWLVISEDDFCPAVSVFPPFYMIHGAPMARILEWFAIPSSRGTLHYDSSILGGPAWQGSWLHRVTQAPLPQLGCDPWGRHRYGTCLFSILK